jgi:signal transduction histidine kinase
MGIISQFPLPRLRPRSLWRSTGPTAPEEVRRTERWLATARVFLAMSALVAAWVDPGEIRSVWAYALLAFYITHGAAVVFLLRNWQESTPGFRLLVHSADIVWPAVISLLTTSQSNPFFLFFVFVIAAAAYRWGVWETVMTSVSAVALLWLDSLALRLGVLRTVSYWLVNHNLPSLNPDVADFTPQRLIMRSVYLVVMGLLLGYLAEQQRKLRAEKDEAGRLLGMIRMDAGMAANLGEIFGEVMRLYHAPRALIASHESRSQKISLARIETRRGIAELEWIDPGGTGADTYLGDAPSVGIYARRADKRGDPDFESLAMGLDGTIKGPANRDFLRRFAQVHPFKRLIAISFSSGPDLSGRVFLLDAELTSSAEEDLQFLLDLVRQIGPAVYNVYLLRRLRKRAGAVERARLVRELHDGAVQSLIGVEMQVDVLRRTHPVAASLGLELQRIQQLLKEEVLKLRELMQEMKSADIDARKLPGFLHDSVDRFQRETGIHARFVMDDQELLLPQPVCRELARISQEALVNVRKHSGAKHVLVQLLESNGSWDLVVEDDGAGFPFEGRRTHPELDKMDRVPAVIRERTRLIDGQLTIESKPGQGARVEVRVAQHRQAAHG